jgi:hypothetical protein
MFYTAQLRSDGPGCGPRRDRASQGSHHRRPGIGLVRTAPPHGADSRRPGGRRLRQPLHGRPARVLYFWHRVGNGVLTLLSNMLTNINLSDMETAYKMVRTDLMKTFPVRTDRFGIEPELTARDVRARARIDELPISYNGRTYEEGRKIGSKDGAAAFWHILRANLSYGQVPSAALMPPFTAASQLSCPVPTRAVLEIE